MSQIFSRHFDIVFRVVLLAGIVFVAGSIMLWRVAISSPLGAVVEQPVPFSHKHHVGEVGLDCRYCHASVETSAYAGMPSSNTCMNCHSQLFTDAALLEPVRESARSGKPLHWNRVYRLPDFVFFDHSIHIADGIGCSNCHGDIARMPLTALASPLTMKWCLDCHRHRERALRTAAATAVTQRRTQQLIECSTCHR